MAGDRPAAHPGVRVHPQRRRARRRPRRDRRPVRAGVHRTPYHAAPTFSRGRFPVRTRRQTASPGFTLLAARREGALVGFAFGLPMAPGSWWANASPPPAEVLNAAKFAVIELVVARRWRRRGLGGELLRTLSKGRPEPYATLAAVIGSPAHAWYLRSGWRKVGEFRVEPPFSDALLLDRRGRTA
ncbi:GNAT family N-acetyltransferase [Thermomonospora catenispora]|nr:GNAT family N-acetyltransferase [Thermomonospora catenispora]TNY34528.1 GNAT family N-acetyltransferase [Thermomonospora catenispora]